MNTPREQERMDQQSNLVTINTLRPVVCMFLDRITSGTWETVQTGRLDEETKTILTDMFVDILEIVAKSLLELLRNRLTEEERGAQKSPEVSEEEVYKRLGNLGEIVTQTVAEVQGVGNIRYSGTQEMTELLVAGVTERVNSKLSQSRNGEDVEEHKTSPGMARKMALHFKKILRKCATKMSKMLSRKKAEQEQEEEEEEEHEGEVRSVQTEEEEEVMSVTQTPGTSLQQDKPSCVESEANTFITSVISVKTILEEHLKQIDIAAIGDGLITEEDMELLNSRSSQDSEELAREIVEILTNSSQQDVVSTLNQKDKSKTVTPTKKSLRKRIASKIKALFVRKYARQSILSVTTKLSDKETSSERETEEELSVQTLLDSVDEVMNDMISYKVLENRSTSPKICLFQKLASYISSGEHDSDAEVLSEALADHLMPEEDNEVKSQVEIRTEVEGFMKRMRNWLNQQVQKCKGKKGNISMAVKQIFKVVSIQPEETSALEEETDTLTDITPKNKASQRSTSQCKEEEVPTVTQTPVTSLQQDDTSSDESEADAITKSVISVKTILEEHWREIAAVDEDGVISRKEMEQLHSRSAQDSDELAIEIVEILTNSSQQDVVSTLNQQDQSKTVTPTKKSLRKRIARKIKALFVRKYARESILSVMTKLSDKETSSQRETEEKPSVKIFLDSVDELMNDMISKVVLETGSRSEEDCLFEKIASYISCGKHDSDAELLSEALADHLMPEEDNDEMSQVEIRTEVEGFMKRMRNWLNQQVQKCKGKKGNISMAVQEISKVVSIQPEETSALEEETETFIDITPKSDERVKSATFAPEHAVPQRSTPKHAVPQQSTSQCAVPQRSTPECAVPQPSTCQCAVPQRSTSDHAVPQQSTPERAVPKRFTPHTPKLQNWDQLTCEIIVLELSRTILKDLPIDKTHSAYKATVAKLTNMLWTEVRGSEVEVDLSSVNLKKICKKVAKKLSKKVGDALLWRSLLSQTQSLNEVVVETLTKQLFPKKTSGIKRFFTRIFKPITSLFKRN
ncbi:DNA ligase 1-like [Notolabrus celidotus]|uniref:DNA ligase 1-like n=1 Tax=Notolabrus celidotus TaxID=1203425 RepID=UPI00149018A3|nr:DNA ligase 1-like [Notolabrus celidotus]